MTEINFLSAWFGVSLLCWLWLWIMAHAVSAAEALRQQHLQQTTPRRRQSDRISEAKARQVFDADCEGTMKKSLPKSKARNAYDLSGHVWPTNRRSTKTSGFI
jgi:hypothetical protein